MKIRCKQRNSIVEGDGRGTFIRCECGKCAVDETPFYWRIIGNYEDFEEIKDDVKTNTPPKSGKSDDVFKDVCKTNAHLHVKLMKIESLIKVCNETCEELNKLLCEINEILEEK